MKKPGRDYPFIFVVPIYLITFPCWVIGSIWAFAVIGLSSGIRGVYNDMFAKEREKARIEQQKAEAEELADIESRLRRVIEKEMERKD